MKEGNQKIVEYLVKSGVDIDQEDERQWSPIHQAIFQRNTRIVQFLVDKGAKLDQNNPNGYSALTSSIERGNNEIVELLIMNGVDINKEDNNMNCPVLVAIINDRKEISKIISEKCITTLKSRNIDGYSPLEYALENQKFDAIKSIIRFD